MAWLSLMSLVERTAQNPKAKYLPQLTGLRFFAAFAIIICHFGNQALPNLPKYLARLNVGFYNAVGLFFVLSGFILAHTYGRKDFQSKPTRNRYFAARFARIYPVFLFALLIDLPVFIVNNRHAFEASTPFRLIQKALLLQTWIPTPTEVSVRWNAPSWSLSTETFFYLAFPFLAPAIGRLSAKASMRWVSALVVGLTGTSLFYDLMVAGRYPLGTPVGEALEKAFINAPYLRLIEFAVGILAYRIYSEIQSGAMRFSRKAWIAALSILASVYVFVSIVGGELLISQGPSTLFFAAIIVWLCTEASRIRTVLENPRVVLLGESSYSLYLIHFPIFYTAFQVARKVGPLQSLVTNQPLLVVSLLAALSVALSVVCFTGLERPMRKRIMDWYYRRMGATTDRAVIEVPQEAPAVVAGK